MIVEWLRMYCRYYVWDFQIFGLNSYNNFLSEVGDAGVGSRNPSRTPGRDSELVVGLQHTHTRRGVSVFLDLSRATHTKNCRKNPKKEGGQSLWQKREYRQNVCDREELNYEGDRLD